MERKLGIGSEDGAGDAWKVPPAKACAAAGLDGAVFGGVVLPCLEGPGEVTCLGRDLLPFRGFDLAWAGWDESAGELATDFLGVNGSRGNEGSQLGMSFSEA